MSVLKIGVPRQLYRPAFDDEIIGIHTLQPLLCAQVQIKDRRWPNFARPAQALPKRRYGFKRVARWGGAESLCLLLLLLVGDRPYHRICKGATVASAGKQRLPLIPPAVFWLMRGQRIQTCFLYAKRFVKRRRPTF